jgi:hypothetical protein
VWGNPPWVRIPLPPRIGGDWRISPGESAARPTDRTTQWMLLFQTRREARLGRCPSFVAPRSCGTESVGHGPRFTDHERTLSPLASRQNDSARPQKVTGAPIGGYCASRSHSWEYPALVLSSAMQRPSMSRSNSISRCRGECPIGRARSIYGVVEASDLGARSRATNEWSSPVAYEHPTVSSQRFRRRSCGARPSDRCHALALQRARSGSVTGRAVGNDSGARSLLGERVRLAPV